MVSEVDVATYNSSEHATSFTFKSHMKYQQNILVPFVHLNLEEHYQHSPTIFFHSMKNHPKNPKFVPTLMI